MICIIDYKMGNLLSIKSAINYLNYDCVISSDNEVIENSKNIVHIIHNIILIISKKK